MFKEIIQKIEIENIKNEVVQIKKEPVKENIDNVSKVLKESCVSYKTKKEIIEPRDNVIVLL